MSPPAPPQLPASLEATGRSTLASEDEWDGELVASADLTGCVAERVTVSACELRGVRFTGAELRALDLRDTRAVDCELSGALMNKASFRRVELVNCRMAGIDLSNATLEDVRVSECKLDGANLRFASSKNTALTDCSLVDADLAGARLEDVRLEHCDLRTAQFAKASLQDVHLIGCELEGIRGAASMAGVTISPEAALAFALSLFAELGIRLESE